MQKLSTAVSQSPTLTSLCDPHKRVARLVIVAPAALRHENLYIIPARVMRPLRISKHLRRAISLFVFLFLLSPLKAQQEPRASEELAESQGTEVTTLTVSFEVTIGEVGQVVSLPLKITSSTPIQEPFQIILRFPPSKLEYAKLGIGQGPRKAGWKLEPELKKAPIAFDMHFLEILVKPGEGNFLPEGGELAFAYFRILEADADHAIELSPSIKQLGETPLEGKTEPAQITALPEGTFACFFYMH